MFDPCNIQGNTVQATRQNVSTRTIFSAISVSPKDEEEKRDKKLMGQAHKTFLYNNRRVSSHGGCRRVRTRSANILIIKKERGEKRRNSIISKLNEEGRRMPSTDPITKSRS